MHNRARRRALSQFSGQKSYRGEHWICVVQDAVNCASHHITVLLPRALYTRRHDTHALMLLATMSMLMISVFRCAYSSISIARLYSHHLAASSEAMSAMSCKRYQQHHKKKAIHLSHRTLLPLAVVHYLLLSCDLNHYHRHLLSQPLPAMIIAIIPSSPPALLLAKHSCQHASISRDIPLRACHRRTIKMSQLP